jgi:hypothetical protein
MCETSEEERKKDWWLNHFQNSACDLIEIVEKTLEGDEQSEKFLRAWLPAFKQTFTTDVGGKKDARKRRSD